MRALVRGLASTFARAISSGTLADPICLELAQQQHCQYVDLLRRLLPPGGVTELPADDEHPDCCFIEDTAVVAGGTAVVARIGAASRQGEEGPVAAALASLGLEVAPPLEAPATLDGGDVLQLPGSNIILVGLSRRTNFAGVSQLAARLPGHSVHGVPLPHGLHLKSLTTALDASTLLFADHPAGRALSATLAAHPAMLASTVPNANGAADASWQHGGAIWRHIMVPDPVCANVLLLEGQGGQRHVVTQGSTDAATEALLDRLCAERGLLLHRLPRATELIKADAALTCCSILLPG